MWKPELSPDLVFLAELLMAQAGVDICTCADFGIDRKDCYCFQTMQIQDIQADVHRTVITTNTHVVTLTAQGADCRRIP